VTPSVAAAGDSHPSDATAFTGSVAGFEGAIWRQKVRKGKEKRKEMQGKEGNRREEYKREIKERREEQSTPYSHK